MNTEKNSLDMNTEYMNTEDMNTEDMNTEDMNTEKNSLDINIEKNSELPQVPRNAFSKLLFSIKSRIDQHRLAIRFSINSRPLHVITIVSIVPFFLGFYDFMNQNPQLKKILFQKNLPTFGLPTESLNWETFRYFIETKKDFLVGIEKVQWSTNSLFLTKTVKTEILDHESFIASIKTSNKNEKFLLPEMEAIGLNRFDLNSQFKKQSLPLLQTFYSNLDEVPLKLDTINSYDMFTRVNKNKSVLSLHEKSESRTKIFRFNANIWNKNVNYNEPSQKINYKNLLVESDGIQKQIPAVIELNTNKISNKVSNKISSTSSFLKKQISWFLEKALKNCKASSISLFSESDDIKKLEEIVSEVEEVLLEHNISPFFRRMSGYSYPDMNSKQVTSFFLHNLFSYLPKNLGLADTTQNDLKIIFPANPTFIKQFSFSNPQIPTKMNIKVKNSTVKNLDLGEILYEDISVFVDSNTGLDWELEKPQVDSLSVGETNLRFWYENYLSPLNPLTHSKDTFDGVSFLSKNPRNFLLSDNDYLLVPFFNENEWKKIYNENKISQIFLDEYTVDGRCLPVIKASVPDSNYKYARLNFDINSTVDYLYSPQIFTTKIKPLSSLHGEFFNETFRPVHYKKIMSIFHKPQFLQKTFSESWEPLTFRSWLIVSQIGLAFLFFNFLKSILSDYFTELIRFLIDFGLSRGIFDENLKEQIELVTGQRDKGYRIISKSKKKFQDIAGIKTLLPEIAEIVWLLRNSGKEFSLSKTIPRGLLLIGPPGTGKTVLVQALGGEAKVPLLTLSGSSLFTPGESAAVKLEFMFQEARQLAPCIVFIDEIDSLAKKRSNVMQNPMGGDEIFSALEPVNTLLDFGQSTNNDLIKGSETSFFKKTDKITSLATKSKKNGEDLNLSPSMKIALEIKQKMIAQQKFQREQLSLLVQLLIELDGLQGRKGVVVIGATNRPELLDPAILRPGRFDKILELGLPNHEKRLEIFKLYGKKLGYDSTISWEYLSRRTVGFAAADLASIMNQSCLKAILNDTKHTLKTIEYGIDRITTLEIEKPSKDVTNFFLHRVAYYQAGKLVLSTILEHHPAPVVSYLWPRRQNRRSLQILTNLQKYFFQLARRCELEHRIVGCYGGKAAEILFLQNFPVNLSNRVSSFGLEDLSFAFVLVCFTVEKWYLYSKSTLITQLTQLISNKNYKELTPEKIDFFKELTYSMQLPPHLFYSDDSDTPTPFSQDFFSSAWWQFYISEPFKFVDRNFADWYRLYLPNPEETQLNIEWSPPDEFYKGNFLTKKVNKNSSITWNDLHNVARDYQVHSLVLDSFNKALSLLDENREYLDKLVFELIKKEVLRESEIEKLAASFLSVKNTEKQNSTGQDTDISQDSTTIGNIATIKIVHNSFGGMSRRKIKNWIDFKDFENSELENSEPTQSEPENSKSENSKPENSEPENSEPEQSEREN